MKRLATMAAGYGPGVDQPICMIEASGTYAGAYYYHFDGLGSVVALSDADGETGRKGASP